MYHVLILDDQRDVRRMLRASLETLGAEIKVIDVPSVEEAALIVSQQAIDLLIVDIRLPGISGLELKERAQVRNPHLKFILITGVEDPKLRQQAANAGAYALFFKPIEIPEFLDAVQRCLGLAEPGALKASLGESSEALSPSKSLSARLASLRQELHAFTVLIANDQAQVVAQAGDQLRDIEEATFLSSLMASFNAANKVSYLLGSKLPDEVIFFVGKRFDVFLMPIGETLGLLLLVPSAVWESERIGKIIRSMRAAVQDLQVILSDMGISLEMQMRPVSITSVEEQTVAHEVEVPSSDLEAIFELKKKKKFKPEEIDAFWETVAQQSADEVSRLDALSYEQARQLGLAPEE